MRGDWVDVIRRRVHAGFGRFGKCCGHRGRLISGVRASLDASDFGGCHAFGGPDVARHRHDPRALGLRAPGEYPPDGEFRGDGELHGARHLR